VLPRGARYRLIAAASRPAPRAAIARGATTGAGPVRADLGLHSLRARCAPGTRSARPRDQSHKRAAGPFAGRAAYLEDPVNPRSTFVIAAAVAPTLLLGLAAAQAPSDSPRLTPADTALVLLQQLPGDTVYARQPLQSPPTPAPAPSPVPAPAPAPAPPGSTTAPPAAPPQGSAADRPFAVVRDAQIGADGRVLAFVVEAPQVAGRDAAVRLLPAKSVQWDAATKRWLTVQPTLQFAELAVHEPGKPAKVQAPLPGRVVLASELLAATWTAAPPPAPADGGARAVDASATKHPAPPRVVWWLAPAHQQVAFAVVPHGEGFLPVPWSAVRTTGAGAQVEARLDNQALASDTAPRLASANDPPPADVRRRCYEHYGAPTPRWDRADEPAKVGDVPPTGSGRDR
jgi:hypothetical protein